MKKLQTLQKQGNNLGSEESKTGDLPFLPSFPVFFLSKLIPWPTGDTD